MNILQFVLILLVPLTCFGQAQRSLLALPRNLSVASPSPVIWFDAGYGATNDGSLLMTWLDKSGNGWNATAVSGAEPTFRSSAWYGAAGVEFDVADDAMWTGYNLTGDYTIFLVEAQKHPDTDAFNARTLNSSNVNALISITPRRSGNNAYVNGSVSSFMATTNAVHVAQLANTNSVSMYRVDRTNQTAATSYNDWGIITFGNIGSSAEKANAYVLELKVYKPALTDAQAQTVENDLKAKWNSP